MSHISLYFWDNIVQSRRDIYALDQFVEAEYIWFAWPWCMIAVRVRRRAWPQTHADTNKGGLWGVFDGERTGQRRWKKHTGGNDERKWCAWWVLNGWPVGRTLSDCLLKGCKTEGETTARRTGKRIEEERAGERWWSVSKYYYPVTTVAFPVLLSMMGMHLSCHAALADQWVITNSKGSEMGKRASSMFYSALIT